NGQVTDAAWVELRGSYTVPPASAQLQLYVESADAGVSYDLDDVTVVMTAAPPEGPPQQAGLSSTFEDGTVQGWAGRAGREQLNVTGEQAHGGARSLLTTGRTQSWMGPSRNVLTVLSKGSKYTISIRVRLVAGESAAALKLSMERRTAGVPSYDRVTGETTVTADGWTELRGSYTLSHDVDFLTLYVESAGSLASFYSDDLTVSYVTPLPIQTDIPSLKQVLAPDFAIGAAIARRETIGLHADLVRRHFSSVTPGNALKWDSTEPTEGQFRFAEADAQVDFGVRNGLLVRGHTLVWHSQVPAWVFQDAAGNDLTPTPADKALLLGRLERHIRAVMGRYAGKISSWDVVNEVVDEYAADGLRDSPWYRITGLDFIRTAFRVAHEVDPAAKLYINDYNTEFARKRDALVKLVRQLQAEGVPLDGVGHQLHINIERPSGAEIERTIQAFARLGLDNQVTELDISVYDNFSDSYATVPPEVLALQGYRYAEVFDALRRQAAHISSVTTWGVGDDGTWLSVFPITRLNPPLLFDDQLQAKPAYWGVVDPSRLPPVTRRLTTPAGAPEIDGNDELEWRLVPRAEIPARGGLAASFALRWGSDRLFLIADVNDTTATGGDAVDVHLGDTRIRLNGSSPPRDVTRAIRHSSAGYRVEASIPLPAAGASGQRLPFDLRVTDANRRAHPLSWNNQANLANPRLGELTLTPAVRRVDAPRGTPVVDGTVDPAWATAPPSDTPVALTGGAGTATATVRTLWDDNRLYVLTTVTDPHLDASSPNVWEQDSVEIFLDPDNTKNRGYEDDDGQYRISFTNRQSLGGNFGAFAIAGNLTSATRVIPGGYVVE
ncbi:MAG TPA: endo-1,4-beta-xylanase, partial [Catenuloplanes sp.]